MNRSDRDSYFRYVQRPQPIEVNPGDLVGYSCYHLFQIGLGPADPMASALGTVLEHHPNGVWVRVRFKEDDDRWVARDHLARPGANRRWANVD